MIYADSDFLHKFDHIGQTRLFDNTWTVTTHWAGVPAPWAMEYSATRFEVTVAHKGPVVFVLSKVDLISRINYKLRC